MKIYKINGVEYNSLDEIPKELKTFITQDLLEKLKKTHSENPQTSLIFPVSDKSLKFKAVKWLLYFVNYMQSLVQNQALRTIAIILNIVDVNIYLSVFFSLLIGHVSYSLAQRYYLRKTANLNIQYADTLDFLKKFEIFQISTIYSFVLNFFFFVILYLAEKFLR